MGLFGEMSFDDIPDGLPRGIHKFIMFVADGKEDENSDEKRISYMLTFEIDGDEEPDFDGMWAQPLYLNTYPTMNEEKFQALPREVSADDRKEGRLDKKMVRGSINAVRAFIRGMGVPPEDWDSFTDLTKFDETKILADTYPDKQTGDPRIVGRSIKKNTGDNGSGGGKKIESFEELGTSMN